MKIDAPWKGEGKTVELRTNIVCPVCRGDGGFWEDATDWNAMKALYKIAHDIAKGKLGHKHPSGVLYDKHCQTCKLIDAVRETAHIFEE